MSKDKFTKIVSFLLSVPCFTSNNIEAMKWTKKNTCSLHNIDPRLQSVLGLFDLIKENLTNNLDFSIKLNRELHDYKNWIKGEDFDYNVKLYSDFASFTIKPKSNKEKTFLFKAIRSIRNIEIAFFESTSEHYHFYKFFYDPSRYDCTIRKLLSLVSKENPNLRKKTISELKFAPSNNKNKYLNSNQYGNRNSTIEKVIKFKNPKLKTQNNFYIENNLFMKKNFNRAEENQSPLVRLDFYKDEDLSTTDNSSENNKKKYEKRDPSKYKNYNYNISSNNYSSKQKIDLYSPVVHLGLRGESSHVGFDNAAKSRKIYMKRKITNK